MILEEEIVGESEQRQDNSEIVTVEELLESAPLNPSVDERESESLVEPEHEAVGEDPKFTMSQLVFVKRKTVHWPGMIVGISGYEIEIKIFHANQIVTKKRLQGYHAFL